MHSPRRPFLALVLALGLVATACGADADPLTTEPVTVDAGDVASVVVLGDSIMEWNIDSGRSIPDVIAQTLDVPVVNASVGGALAGEVPAQYAETDGTAQWVVFDGGGNDLNDVCGCGECSAVTDAIVSTDGTAGVLAGFTEELVAAGKRVAVVGYYDLPPGAEFGFDECGDDIAELESRMRALAARFDEVIFVDPSEVVGADDVAAFDDDLVHPSPEGSRIVGEQIAGAISSAS